MNLKEQMHELFGGDHVDGCGVCGTQYTPYLFGILTSPFGAIEICPQCRYQRAVPIGWVKEAVKHDKLNLIKSSTLFIKGKYVDVNSYLTKVEPQPGEVKDK